MSNYKKLILFLIITFGITYSSWWTLAGLTQLGLLEYGDDIFMLLYMLGGISPTIVPFIIIPLLEGKEGIKEYNRHLSKWRISGLWYLAAFLIVLVKSVLIIGIYFLVSHGDIQHEVLPLYFIALFIPVMILGGGLEELGWRGVALPELQKKFNATASTILLAIIWAFWHLPLFFIKGVFQYGTNFLVFTILIISISFILSWLYNNTESILLCVLYHTFYNSFYSIGWLFYNEGIINAIIITTVFFGFAVLIILIFGYKTLTLSGELYRF